MNPAATVVVSTYNRPRSLELVLAGFARQSFRDFELIIADDGSKEETGRLVRSFESGSTFPIRHVWQEDHGFRKTRILNRAVLEAASDYLIFCDGDCLPHRSFVLGHLQTREQGRFLFGHAVFLGPASTESICRADVESGRFERWGLAAWVPGGRGNDSRRYNGIYLGTGWWSRAAGRWFDSQGRRARGRNFSVARQDLTSVNGWNQDYERPGREDDDLVIRLTRLGLRGKSVRFRALVYHLYHPPHPRELFATNDEILQGVIRSGKEVCRNGIRKL